MAKSRKPKDLPVSIDGSAKVRLEASARATYAVKKTVHQVVPEDVTRARSKNWLDFLSPATEWAGLEGDRIRYRREILRLQHEEALAELATRVRSKLDHEPIGPYLSAKTFVRTIE